MKQLFFLFALLVSIATSAQSGITVNPVSADYANKTVTFRVSWANSSRTGTHNSKVWVFVDYRTVTGNAPTGNWSRALISGTPTATSGTPTRETGNDQGFWLQGTSGSSGTYNATVTVALSNVPAQFNWCAYVSDYPPNAAAVSSGTYTLKGTKPFKINTTTINDTKYTGALQNSLTDATGCPGCLDIRDHAVVAGIPCCPRLTAAGGYCRDLTADAADKFAGCGYDLEVKNATTAPTAWSANLGCSAGWRPANVDELSCMYRNTHLNAIADVYATGDTGSAGTGNDCCGTCDAFRAYYSGWDTTDSCYPQGCSDDDAGVALKRYICKFAWTAWGQGVFKVKCVR